MKAKNEWITWAVVLAPFLYLAAIWNTLPAEVPLHWNLRGEIDRYGGKGELILIPVFLPLFTYLILAAIPFLDPKGKIRSMGMKYRRIRLSLTALMSLLAICLIRSVQHATLMKPGFLISFFGVFFVVMGYYFRSLKANYFIGIRTPWTLEDERVWHDTHRLGGILWLGGGIAMIAAGLFLDPPLVYWTFLGITLLLILIPVVYSFVRFRQLRKEGS